jgi:hypothetical protein
MKTFKHCKCYKIFLTYLSKIFHNRFFDKLRRNISGLNAQQGIPECRIIVFEPTTSYQGSWIIHHKHENNKLLSGNRKRLLNQDQTTVSCLHNKPELHNSSAWKNTNKSKLFWLFVLWTNTNSFDTRLWNWTCQPEFQRTFIES